MNRSRNQTVTAALILTLLVGSVACRQPASRIETVVLPSPESPLIAVRLLFAAGSIHDPAGKEGLAALTGLMIGEAGTARRSYSELIDELYPMAASIEVRTDRETTLIAGEIHRDKLTEFTELLTEVVLEPAFDASDFARNKEQLLSYLTTTLRATNDELLGLEAIQQAVFAGHPYEHSPAGTVQGLESITLEDVKGFYESHYTQSRLMLGVAGGYPKGYVHTLEEDLSRLPGGQQEELAEPPEPAMPAGRRFTLVEKETDSVGIHIAFPLPVNRSDPDFYPLLVANSFLGEHRTFHGRLMQQLRGERGLNYGDYSYIEYWHLPPFTTNPTPNVPRRQQFFSIWVRPVVPETAHFALRNALYELDRLLEQGLTAEEFELTRDYLINYSKLWAQSLAARLGFMMDSRFYGMNYFIDEIESRLSVLQPEDVRAAVAKYLQSDDFRAVLVTDDAADLAARLEAGEPSPMAYNTPPDEDVVEADKTIQEYPVRPAEIGIIPVAEMFEQ